MSETASWIDVLRHPVDPETRRRLAEVRRAVPARLSGPGQFLGRQYVGCGATIGAMPRCDFACHGCYLGEGANRVPALPVPEVEAQLDALRAWLGPGGNVQLTDGEFVLRPHDEVVHLIRHARAIGLVPMLMTHGDGILREPWKLEDWMKRAGLREISLHIDVTQRGRRNRAHRDVRHERELHPLRDEFAELVRGVRARTGLPLDVASTVTVTSGNLDGVADVVRWVIRNADAFKMVSFQPLAPVGRTARDLEGVTPDALWAEIAKGLGGGSPLTEALGAARGRFGHPDCGRFVQGLVVALPGRSPRFHPLLRYDDPVQAERLDRLLDGLGGLTFRLDGSRERFARALAVLLRHGALLARDALPLVLDLVRRSLGDAPVRELVPALVRGRLRANYLNLVSHHFMGAAELRTEAGRERCAECVFKVPIDGELVSMCEANAGGRRDDFYARLAGARS